MATETTNYHFIKPGDADPVDNTPLNQNFDSIDAAIAGHVADTTNPHQTTKEQVGLGNVDNTSDADKPISTAMQAALADKITIEDVLGAGTALAAGDSMDDLIYPCKFYSANGTISASVQNAPIANKAFFGYTMRSISPNAQFIQIAIENDENFIIYKRRYTGTWGAWYKITGEPVAVAASLTATEPGGEVM